MPDRDTLIAMLRESGTTFTDSFRHLDGPSYLFRPGPDRWSIANTAEHVVLAETGSGKLMRGRLVREPTPPGLLAQTTGADARIDARLLVRAARLPAPDFVAPTGRWPVPADAVEVFEASRSATIEFLTTTDNDLATFAAPHPALGPLTGLQWAYFLVRHCLRHVEQIEEVKAAEGYPT